VVALGDCMDETFPDLGSLSDQELKDVIQQLTEEELEVSYRRRILHGKIDILRAELVNRLRKKHESGEDVLSVTDVDKLTDILAGGGRTGESFPLEGERLTVGRRPESDIFLDDVTVSRDHAVIVRRGAEYHLDDLGSLNGTYVNRQRVDSRQLEDGDELQIGKYKLSYLHK